MEAPRFAAVRRTAQRLAKWHVFPNAVTVRCLVERVHRVERVEGSRWDQGPSKPGGVENMRTSGGLIWGWEPAPISEPRFDAPV